MAGCPITQAFYKIFAAETKPEFRGVTIPHTNVGWRDDLRWKVGNFDKKYLISNESAAVISEQTT
jgi:hypothetical protein